MTSVWSENKEIQILQEYLRIPSVHPDVDYEPCLKFLKKQAESLNLLVTTIYPSHPKKPVLIMTWTGTNPELQSILLNSHMDVVPVYEEYWKYPPFSAEIDNNGNIFARGSQDMKSIGTQYLAAIRVLKSKKLKLKRTIHVSFVPDEEITGSDGMEAFVKTEDFKKLNVGFSLDESAPSPTEEFYVYYAERTLWHVQLEISGNPGHGCLFIENTVAEKLRILLNQIIDFRNDEMKKLKDNPNLLLGDVTTINVTQFHGGVQNNVIPPILNLNLDIRLGLGVDHQEFEEKLKSWCQNAGGDIEIIYIKKELYVPATKIDETNSYWVAFKNTLDELGLKLDIKPCIGVTDSRFIRAAGIPAIGFSPINNTEFLIHAHNEYICADTYLKGIEIYEKLLVKLANL